MPPLADYPFTHFANPRFSISQPYGPRQSKVLDDQGFHRAWSEIRRWPGYSATPVIDLDGLAEKVGLAKLKYKDEGGRFGLGSFKALGGAYAVLRQLLLRIEEQTGKGGLGAEDLLSGRYRSITEEVTVACATDGNHGRSVAWGAQLFGCNCVIYIHATVSEGRRQAIERFGARVVRTAGNYDDSVRRAAEDAAREGWIVVSDTSYPGYMDIPRDVMHGYGVMAAEALQQCADDPPTHVFIPGGVGGFAAAVCAQFWLRLGRERPRLIVVEPDRADCLYRSAVAGRPMPSQGDLETIMAGLACGEVSLLAWEILEAGASDFMRVPEAAAADCMRLLADGQNGDPPIIAGESAVAGLAGCLLAAADGPAARALGLDADARVLLFGSEGATDAEVYRRIVGRTPQEVQAA